MHDTLLGHSLREPPNNLIAEQALLGALFADNRAYANISFLRADHFSDPINAKIYQAITARLADGKIADAVTLQTEFDPGYLAHLLASMVAPGVAREYAQEIVDCALRRRLIEMAETVVANAFGDGPRLDCASQITVAMDHLSVMSEEASGGMVRRAAVMLSDAVAEAAERAAARYRGELPVPVPTGLQPIDRALGGGIPAGTLIYLLGATGVGKTELALQLAETVALRARQTWEWSGGAGPCPGCLYLSWDMTAEQLADRSAARLGRLRLRQIRYGELADASVGQRLVEAERAALAIPVEIHDRVHPTLSHVAGEIRRFIQRRPCALAVVDNFSNLISHASDDTKGLFFKAISVTATLKRLATETGVPILLLMHMREGAKTRPDPMPRYGDIPWGCDKDADIAFGIWRPLFGLPSHPPDRGKGQREEQHMAEVDQWHRRRDELANVTEVVSIKLREADGEHPSALRLIFDRDRHSFYDPSERTDGTW